MITKIKTALWQFLFFITRLYSSLKYGVKLDFNPSQISLHKRTINYKFKLHDLMQFDFGALRIMVIKLRPVDFLTSYKFLSAPICTVYVFCAITVGYVC